MDAPEKFDPSTLDLVLGAFDSRKQPHSLYPPTPFGEAVVEKMTQQGLRLPLNTPPQNRLLGRDKRLFTIPEDFDDPLPEDIQAAFEGRLP
jgi:hypothetical protein